MYFYYKDTVTAHPPHVFYRHPTDDPSAMEIRSFGRPVDSGWIAYNIDDSEFERRLKAGEVVPCDNPDCAQPKSKGQWFYFKDKDDLTPIQFYYRHHSDDLTRIDTRKADGSDNWRPAHGDYDTFDRMVTEGEIEPINEVDMLRTLCNEPRRIEDMQGGGILYVVSNRTDMPSSALAWAINLDTRTAYRCTDEGNGRVIWEWANYLGLCELWGSNHIRRASTEECAKLPPLDYKAPSDEQKTADLVAPYEWVKIHETSSYVLACGFHAMVTKGGVEEWHTVVLDGGKVMCRSVSTSEQMAKHIFASICMGHAK